MFELKKKLTLLMLEGIVQAANREKQSLHISNYNLPPILTKYPQ